MGTLSATTSPRWQEPALADAIAMASRLAHVVDQVHSAEDLLPALTEAATLAANGLGFAAATFNLHRPGTDDYEVAITFGTEQQVELLTGTVVPGRSARALLQERFERLGSYFIPNGSYDWDAEFDATLYVPDIDACDDPTRWHPDDALVVPLRSARGDDLLGLLWLDEPLDGLRPSDAQLALAALIGRHTAHAVEVSAAALAEADYHRALRELVQTSLHLHDGDLDEVLRTIAWAVRDSLGFGRVAIALRGDTDAPRSHVGWPRGDADWAGWAGTDALLGLVDPALEQHGCALITAAEHEARLCTPAPAPAPLRSAADGCGERAWRHWLIVPLRDAHGATIGVVLADDPATRLLPGPDQLGALRLFADQAATAIGAARRREELARLARQDALTRLPNRLAFDERLAAALQDADGGPVSLVLCDLDGFKSINDEHGHVAGDAALCRAAVAITGSVRAEDRAFRLAGDEFAIVVAGSGRAARRVAWAVRSAVRELGLSASLGVATLGADDTAATLAARADRGLYRDKQGRRR